MTWDLKGKDAGPLWPDTLGNYAFDCLGDVTLCKQGFSIGAKIKRLQMVNGAVDDSHRYILSSGGQSPLSQGFYVRENHGQELEVGVGISDRLWRATFNVTTGEWVDMAFTWMDGESLSLYVDGVITVKSVQNEQRLSLNRKYDPFPYLAVGMSNDGIHRSSSNFAMYDLRYEDRVWTAEDVAKAHREFP